MLSRLETIPWGFSFKSSCCGTIWFILIVGLTDFGFKSTDWLCAVASWVTLCCAKDSFPRVQAYEIPHSLFPGTERTEGSNPLFSLTWVYFWKCLFSFPFSTLSLHSPVPHCSLTTFKGEFHSLSPLKNRRPLYDQSSPRTWLPTCGLSLLSSAAR